jgi:hypothetical protein
MICDNNVTELMACTSDSEVVREIDANAHESSRYIFLFDQGSKSSEANMVVPDIKVTVMKFDCSEFTSSRLLPPNAPPPKLHFKTFWRSVSRRLCLLDTENVKQEARRARGF